jgi:DNA-binding transcriptional regulator YhcF (GntR family)
MLSKLFGSKARVKLLKLFLSQPEKRFYIRQLARDLKLQVNSVRRELENLEQFGILTSDNLSENEIKKMQTSEDFLIQTVEDVKRVNSAAKTKKAAALVKSDKKFYQANKNFVLFEEIKALIIKAQILYEKDFIEKLYKLGNPKVLILSGIFVNNPQAKVDMFVVGRLNKPRLIRLIHELEKELGREINYSVMGIAEYKYRRDITDVFLYDLLEGEKIVVMDEIGKGN